MSLKPSVNGVVDQKSLEHMRRGAYQLWEVGGCQAGNDTAPWIQAEEDIHAPDQLRPRASGRHVFQN